MDEAEHGDHNGGDRWQPVHGTEPLAPSDECLVSFPPSANSPAAPTAGRNEATRTTMAEVRALLGEIDRARGAA